MTQIAALPAITTLIFYILWAIGESLNNDLRNPPRRRRPK